MMWRVCKQSCGRDAYVQCPVVEDGLDLDDHVEIFFGRNSRRLNKICENLCQRGAYAARYICLLLQFFMHK